MKKVLGSAVLCAMAVAVFCTTKSVNSSSNLQLSQIAKLNVANAECRGGGFVSGHCVELTGTCYFGGGGCDPYAPN